MIGPVLVVDDDPDVLHAARVSLAPSAERVETATNPDALRPLLTGQAFDAVLLDMNFARGETSGREGLSRLDELHALDPSLAVVLMTTFGGVSLAVEALKHGASDFVLKPWRNARLIETITLAAERTRAARAAASSFDLDAVERAEISRALDHHAGNISRAAAALGLTRPALYRKMAKHGL